MEIQIRAKGLPGAAAIRQHAAGKLRDFLHRFDGVVDAVNILVIDINGPNRGGIDKLCRAVIRMRDSSLFSVEELGKDVGTVIERIAERIRQCITYRARRLSHSLQVLCTPDAPSPQGGKSWRQVHFPRSPMGTEPSSWLPTFP